MDEETQVILMILGPYFVVKLKKSLPAAGLARDKFSDILPNLNLDTHIIPALPPFIPEISKNWRGGPLIQNRVK